MSFESQSSFDPQAIAQNLLNLSQKDLAKALKDYTGNDLHAIGECLQTLTQEIQENTTQTREKLTHLNEAVLKQQKEYILQKQNFTVPEDKTYFAQQLNTWSPERVQEEFRYYSFFEEINTLDPKENDNILQEKESKILEKYKDSPRIQSEIKNIESETQKMIGSELTNLIHYSLAPDTKHSIAKQKSFLYDIALAHSIDKRSLEKGRPLSPEEEKSIRENLNTQNALFPSKMIESNEVNESSNTFLSILAKIIEFLNLNGIEEDMDGTLESENEEDKITDIDPEITEKEFQQGIQKLIQKYDTLKNTNLSPLYIQNFKSSITSLGNKIQDLQTLHNIEQCFHRAEQGKSLYTNILKHNFSIQDISFFMDNDYLFNIDKDYISLISAENPEEKIDWTSESIRTFIQKEKSKKRKVLHTLSKKENLDQKDILQLNQYFIDKAKENPVSHRDTKLTPFIQAMSPAEKILRIQQESDFYNFEGIYPKVYQNINFTTPEGKVSVTQTHIQQLTQKSKSGNVLIVDKENYQTYVFKNGKLDKKIISGQGQWGSVFFDKVKEGDRTTPLGIFNARQSYGEKVKSSLHLNYPLPAHQKQAQELKVSAGNGIMVHSPLKKYYQTQENRILSKTQGTSLGCIHILQDSVSYVTRDLVGEASNDVLIVVLPKIDSFQTETLLAQE